MAWELRRSWERAEANGKLLRGIVAGLPYPERRVFELCNDPDGQSLTEAEAAAEIGCSVKTVRRLRQRGGAKIMYRFEQECRRNAE
jgi:DNA-directed RNA polymerase specialized sigma24 family protein